MMPPGRLAHHGGEIRQRVGPCRGLIRTQRPRAVLRLRGEEGGDLRAGRGLLRFGDGVLQVEQDDVRGSRGRFLHLALAVPGREQPGAGSGAICRGSHVCGYYTRELTPECAAAARAVPAAATRGSDGSGRSR